MVTVFELAFWNHECFVAKNLLSMMDKLSFQDCLPTLAEVLILGSYVLGFTNHFNRPVLVAARCSLIFSSSYKFYCTFCIVARNVSSSAFEFIHIL